MTSLNKAGQFTLLTVACLTIMVGCVIVPDLNRISVRLGVADAASWLVTMPSLGVVIFSPAAGRLIERIGARRALAGGLFLYGLLGAGGVFFYGLYPVLTERLLLGGATAIVMSAGTMLISEFYSGQARLKMIALQGMSIELGGVIFLFIGGLLAFAGWFWPFALYLVAWGLLAMLLLFIPETVSRESDEAVAEGADKQGDPSGSLVVVYFAAVFSMVSFFTAIVFLPRHLSNLQVTASEVGYFLSFISLVAMGAAALMPKVVVRIKEFATLYTAFGCYVCGHLIFALSPSVYPLIVGGIFMGLGFGFSVPLLNHLTIEKSHGKYRGRNLAKLSMSIFLGQFLSSFTEFISKDIPTLFYLAAAIGLLVIVSIFISRSLNK